MSGWHVEAQALGRYSGGAADPATAASIEAHLVRCTECRGQLTADSADVARLAGIWDDIVDVMDTPRSRPLERLLRAASVDAPTARLVALTPAFRHPFLASAAAALAFAALAANAVPGRGSVLLLIVAPLLPVAGVVLAFGRDLNEMYEFEVVAPLSWFRLLMLRTLAVVAVSAVLSALAGLAVPGPALVAAWLCPALALCTVTLAAGHWFDIARTAVAVSVAWVVGVVLATDGGRTTVTTFGPTTQVVCALVAALAAALVLRNERSEFNGGTI